VSRSTANWGNVTLIEFDALSTLRREPADILQAAKEYRRRYLPALVVAHDEPAPNPDAPYFNEVGEAWVARIVSDYATALREGDELDEVRLAREWVAAVGFLATVGIAKALRA
jgi:hypothetical protein